MKNTLKQITERVNSIPAVSSNTIQILNLISKFNYDAENLVNLVSQDVVITARCMQIVNSAAFGLRTPIVSIERAVKYLGSKTILGIVIKQDFGDIFSKPLDGLFGEENELWNHSLRTAIAARQVAQEVLEHDSADIVYTGGLLHDIGKIIISDFLNKSGQDICEKYELGKVLDFPAIESKVLRIDHAEVGFMMAHKWGFPDVLKSVIRYHLSPNSAPDEHQKLCAIVHLGDIIAMLGGYGTGLDTLAYKFDNSALELLNLQKKSIATIYLNIDLEYEEVVKTFCELGEKNAETYSDS